VNERGFHHAMTERLTVSLESQVAGPLKRTITTKAGALPKGTLIRHALV